MHVGLCAFFQNLDGQHTDREVWQHECSMADLAEPLGFDSVWAAEHHVTGYDMCPNTTQFLTWVAARTTKALLGSMVVVLPWHDPLRLAEELSVLDHVSNGRTILGIGRGLGRVEFEAFRTPMGESRRRFNEHAEALLTGLESGVMEYDGELYRQPPAAIRPRPFRSFRGRTYAAAVSPETAKILCKLGIGMLIIAQKPWETTLKELADYRATFLAVNGVEAPAPALATWIVCHEDEERARELLHDYIYRYSRSALEHYEFDNAALASIPGYEYYGALAANIAKHGRDRFVQFLGDLQIWGTPDQVYEKIREHQRLVGNEMLVGVFSFGGMHHDEAKRNLHLFAERVLPRLKHDAA